MIFRTLLFLMLFCQVTFAQYQLIKIGKIDNYYNDKLSESQLRAILEDIEDTFETQLQENIFDFSANGKPINIIYLPASKLEKQILSLVGKIEQKKKKIEKYQSYFPKKKKEIERLKKAHLKKSKELDKKIAKFNAYIKDINSKKRMDIDEFEAINKIAKEKKYKLNKEIDRVNAEAKQLRKIINGFNKKVSSYNAQTQAFNKLNRDLEVMNRNFRKIKGRTYGIREIFVKNKYENGKKVKSKNISVKMSKIEVYGFSSIGELKAILAHEIAHLVGIPHVNKKYALMNPLLQKNQIENLQLTRDDIEAFRKYF